MSFRTDRNDFVDSAVAGSDPASLFLMRLNRSHILNKIDHFVHDELRIVLNHFERNDRAKCGILYGSGGLFSSGYPFSLGLKKKRDFMTSKFYVENSHRRKIFWRKPNKIVSVEEKFPPKIFSLKILFVENLLSPKILSIKEAFDEFNFLTKKYVPILLFFMLWSESLI